MNYEELERLINESFKDAIKQAAKQAAKASVNRGRAMRGAGPKKGYGTSTDPFRSFMAGLKGEEAPQEGIFKGETDPRKYNQGLKEIVEFYEKVTHVDPVKNQNIKGAVSDLKKAQSAIEQLMSAASNAEPQQQPDQQPDQQQGSEQEPENNA